MSSASQFFGGGAKPPKLLVGSNDTDTAVISPIGSFDTAFGAKLNLRITASGATTAGAYKSLVSVGGSGVLSILLLQSLTAGPRDMFIKVTIDGVVVLERQKNAAGFWNAVNAVGAFHSTSDATASFLDTDYLPFSKSLDISVKSSLSETDQIAIAYRYHTT